MSPTCRILLAEDNPTNQKVALLQLRKIGLSADTAVNGAEALRMCQSNDYDIILMDCQMPEMDGYEATRVLRRWASSSPPLLEKSPRIIALTANALRGDRDKCLAAGMDDYIAKPVTLDGLRDVIFRHLPKNEAAPPAPAPAPAPSPSAPAHTAPPTVPPAPGEPELIDLERLRSVTLGSGGEPDAEALSIFQAAMMELPGRLDALARKSGLDLMRDAHQLKGMVAVFGLTRLSDMLGELQGMAGTASQAEIARSVGQLRTVCADSLMEVTEHLPFLG